MSPHEEGTMRGEGIEPLYPSVPAAALRSKPLHELLAMVDALRVGKVREIELAAKILKQRFDEYALLPEQIVELKKFIDEMKTVRLPEYPNPVEVVIEYL